MAVTVQTVAARLLNYLGVTQFTPQPAGSELEDAHNHDLDNAASAITAAMQEIAALSPMENREKSTGAAIHAPADVTLDATGYSATVANFTTYASWMAGCTIRITGDDQDNEIISATELARPYMGSTGNAKGATVYGDCITLDSAISRAVAPLWLPNQLPMPICDTLDEFMRLAGYPAIVGVDGNVASSPFFYFVRKSIARPRVALAQGAYSSALSYVPRRLRFAPLPDQAYPLGFRAVLNPPRYTRADIVSPLVTLAATGATSDALVNQSYTYLADVNGYRYFKGVTTPAYSIFFHPSVAKYIIASSLKTYSTPASYWTSNLVTSPLGTYAVNGAATGIVTVTTSDSGGGEGDPGTLLPIVDGAVESVLIPIALQRFSGTASFKNDAARPEILRQYRTARDTLLNSRGIGKPASEAIYQ